jgi:GNAT superfamily N-acetyltransferase
MSNNNITLRPAQRPDIPALTNLANAANARSVLHRRIAPRQHEHASDYYLWRRNIIRQRFATPDLRTMVAEDSSTGKILGQASWAVEGSDTALYKRWTAESSWMTWLEGKLIEAEKLWCRYVTDRSVDYEFLDGFMAAFLGAKRAVRPPCLHLHLIVIDPEAQGKGVGRVLLDWGEDLAVKEDLPLFLESNLEAVGFYEKSGLARLSHDVAVDAGDGREAILIPAFVWEGEERKGRWLELDGDDGVPEGRWRWKDEVLPK